jgi:hypothetical protein
MVYLAATNVVEIKEGATAVVVLFIHTSQQYVQLHKYKM